MLTFSWAYNHLTTVVASLEETVVDPLRISSELNQFFE